MDFWFWSVLKSSISQVFHIKSSISQVAEDKLQMEKENTNDLLRSACEHLREARASHEEEKSKNEVLKEELLRELKSVERGQWLFGLEHDHRKCMNSVPTLSVEQSSPSDSKFDAFLTKDYF